MLALAIAGRSKGWGIVEFETPEEVSRLLTNDMCLVSPAGKWWLHCSFYHPSCPAFAC